MAKAERKTFSIRIDKDIRTKLEKEAKSQNRTLANLIDTILLNHVSNGNPERGGKK